MVNIGSGNDSAPVRRRAIPWSNADSLSIWTIATNFSGILMQNTTIFVEEKKTQIAEYAISKMTAIFFRAQCELPYTNPLLSVRGLS